ncbi:MAG: hypothetical protein IKQ40_05905 [Lachnospiraceae bacterium]|nr:hypothetical protein [Lachnospiraceae bacterium]
MMKGFGKFVTFVGVTGAALAGLWYFCEMNKEKCACDAGDAEDGENDSKERSYVSLDPEFKEDAKKVAEDVKEAAGDVAAAAESGRKSLKKAIKSVANDMITKAEEAASGVGLVKEDKKTSDFEFEDFGDAAGEAAEKAADTAEKAASRIDIQ